MGKSSLADCGFYTADLQTLNEQLFIVLYITEKIKKLTIVKYATEPWTE